MNIYLKVKPNSNNQEIKKISENEYFVHLKNRAEDNKANIELLKLLKRYFKKEIKIIRGLKSRDKIIQLND